MSDTIIQFIEEQIEQLEKDGKYQDELYIGLSNLSEEVHENLKTLGWRAIYVEHGIFQLIKL